MCGPLSCWGSFLEDEPSQQLTEDALLPQVALAGFTEILTWILGSNLENFVMVNREEDKKKAAVVGNPRTSEFEVSILKNGVILFNRASSRQCFSRLKVHPLHMNRAIFS